MMKLLFLIKKLLDSNIFMSSLFVLFFVLSWVGVYNSHPYDKPLFTAGYDALRLFTLSGNDLSAVNEWQWNDRNWLLLIMVWMDALYLVLAVFSFFTEQSIRYLLSTGVKRDSVVVIGLGRWGLYYVKALVNAGFPVVAIERQPTQEAMAELIELRKNKKNVSLIVGDCFEDNILDKAAVPLAKKVLPMLSADAENIDMTYKIRNFLKNKGATSPVILLAVDNIRLSTSLATYKRFSDHNGEVEVRFFNIMQAAVVRHLDKYPPELYADIFKQENVHFAIYGFGNFALNLIYVLAHLGHYRTWELDENLDVNEAKKVRLTIYDQKPRKVAMDDLKALFPNLEKIFDITYISIELMNIDFNKDLEVYHYSVTQHYFCVNNETLAVRYATKLRKAQMFCKNKNTPIFVRSLDGKGLSRLIESNCGDKEWPDNIFPLTVLNDGMGSGIYFCKTTEWLAKLLNNASDPEGKWSKLSADFKHSNFFLAAFLPIRLRSIGYQLQDGKANVIKDDTWCDKNHKKHMLSLALLEHERWKSERWLLGWNCIEDKDSRTLGDIARLHHELEEKSVNGKWGFTNEEGEDTWDVTNVKELPNIIYLMNVVREYFKLKENRCRWTVGESNTVEAAKELQNCIELSKDLYNHFMGKCLIWCEDKVKKYLDEKKSIKDDNNEDKENIQFICEIIKSLTNKDYKGLQLKRQRVIAASFLDLKSDELKCGDIVLFNLMNTKDVEKVNKLYESKKENLDDLTIIGLLPVPFDILKAWENVDANKKCLDGISQVTTDKISELCGNIDVYIEMPLLMSFERWTEKEKGSYKTYLESANKCTNEYIRIRATNVPKGKQGVLDKDCPIKWTSAYLPKPGLKEE